VPLFRRHRFRPRSTKLTLKLDLGRKITPKPLVDLLIALQSVLVSGVVRKMDTAHAKEPSFMESSKEIERVGQ